MSWRDAISILERHAREQMARFDRRAPEQPPPNVVDLSAERAKRWLLKHTRPMPQKDPPDAAA